MHNNLLVSNINFIWLQRSAHQARYHDVPRRYRVKGTASGNVSIRIVTVEFVLRGEERAKCKRKTEQAGGRSSLKRKKKKKKKK